MEAGCVCTVEALMCVHTQPRCQIMVQLSGVVQQGAGRGEVSVHLLTGVGESSQLHYHIQRKKINEMGEKVQRMEEQRQ